MARIETNMEFVKDYIARTDESEELEKTKVERKIATLRKENEAFDGLVAEITQKIEQQIEETNNIRSFKPTDSTYHKVHMKVKAVPITLEEKMYLLKYLTEKYLDKVAGDIFELRKCWLSEQYLIKTYCWEW